LRVCKRGCWRGHGGLCEQALQERALHVIVIVVISAPAPDTTSTSATPPFARALSSSSPSSPHRVVVVLVVALVVVRVRRRDFKRVRPVAGELQQVRIVEEGVEALVDAALLQHEALQAQVFAGCGAEVMRMM
jgi:hypothetical protein